MHIQEATLDWLLEENNPSVRYLTLVNILDKREDHIDVIGAKERLMKEGPIPKILAQQNADGSFINQRIVGKYGEARARAGYQPKYKATTWQALFLAQMGADANDQRIQRLGNFVLNANYHRDYRVFGIYAPTLRFGALPCFVSNMVWSLSRLGFYEDERVQDSINWILRYQRFDDGDFKTPNSWPYRGSKDRCFGKHSCYIGCTQALKAMTVIPPEERNQEIEGFVKRAIDFILRHKVYKKSRGVDKPVRKEYELLTLPLTYYDDLLQIVETLLFFKVKSSAIDQAIEFILAKQDQNGYWPLEKTVSSSAMHTKIEEKSKESKWITYRAISVLKKYNQEVCSG